jgi:hypothetical protein
MKHKTLTIILGMIFLIGIATASTLTNIQGIDVPLNVIAGDTFQVNFSFDYLDDFGNKDNSPLIIRLNFTSNDSVNYPVWKGDFGVNGYIEKSYLLGLYIKTIQFNCSEEENQTITHSTGVENVYAPDGIFYCYNEEGDLKLDRKYNVFLNIKSHHALWPGQYNILVELMEMESDTITLLSPPAATGGRGGYSSSWECEEWSECINGTQTRTCENTNRLQTNRIETRDCALEFILTEQEPVTLTTTIPGFFSIITGAVIGTLGTGGTIFAIVFVLLFVALVIVFGVKGRKK